MENSLEFDVRVPPTVEFEEIEGRINSWCKEAGSGVKAEFLYVVLIFLKFSYYKTLIYSEKAKKEYDGHIG